jgi:hypothetical protein
MEHTQVFKASRWKSLLIGVGSALLALGSFMMTSAEPIVGWTGVVLFGIFALAGLAACVHGGASLVLDEDGFQMNGLFGPKRERWFDIDSIGLVKVRGTQLIGLNYKIGDPRRSQVSRAMTGMDRAIGGSAYNVSTTDLCSTLEQWHARYRDPSQLGRVVLSAQPQPLLTTLAETVERTG